MPAHAQVFSFDSLVHGEIVTNQFEPALTITASNPNRPFDIVAGFDTGFMGSTTDPDLLGPPWSGGTLAVSDTAVDIGTVLILAENDDDADNDGILDDPDDEARRPSGTMDLVFAEPISVFGMDIIDIQGDIEETTTVDFFAGGSLLGTLRMSDLTDPGSPYFDPTISFGNNTANRLSPISATDFGVAAFDRVVLNIGGSSAYDTFVVP
ncbi:MAG: hypothetical protein AAGF47_08600, partial [Planctomycetota bacterium]